MFLSLPGWMDWLAKAWPLLAALGGAGVMSALARATVWLSAWGPIAWGGTFLAAFLALYGAFLAGVRVTARARETRAMARYTEMVAGNQSINPLDRLFERKRVNLSDFYHPFFKWHENPIFRHSEIFGPANLIVRGMPTFVHSNFNDCEYVIVKPGSKLTNVVGLDSPILENCDVYRVTFFLLPDDARRFAEAAGGCNRLNVISQGIPSDPGRPASA
jgi:hypothetical protein